MLAFDSAKIITVFMKKNNKLDCEMTTFEDIRAEVYYGHKATGRIMLHSRWLQPLLILHWGIKSVQKHKYPYAQGT